MKDGNEAQGGKGEGMKCWQLAIGFKREKGGRKKGGQRKRIEEVGRGIRRN